MILTYLSRAIMTIAIGLAVLSLVLLLKPAPGPGASSIKPADVAVDMKEIKAHVKTPFQFTLTNEGSRTWKVVGTPSICSKAGCVWAVDPPTELAPDQTATFQFLCDANLTGPVELETAIYLEGREKEGITIPVKFKGTVEESSPALESLP